MTSVVAESNTAYPVRSCLYGVESYMINLQPVPDGRSANSLT
jgi:hypothetical protein